jgi:hypothetical protein
VCVDRSWVPSSAGGSDFQSGGERRFDCLVGRTTSAVIALRPGRDRLVAACPAYPADDLFATEFFQIVSGAAGAVLLLGLFAECANSSRELGGREAVADADKAISASATWRMRCLLRSIPPTLVLPTREAAGRRSRRSSAMKH